MMLALVEQQKLLDDKDAKLNDQQKLINVLEERLRLMQQRKFGTSSEKNLSQLDWLADEAELLADGEPDADDGEIEEPEQGKAPRKRRSRKGFSKDLPRIQQFIRSTDEEREGAIETFLLE